MSLNDVKKGSTIPNAARNLITGDLLGHILGYVGNHQVPTWSKSVMKEAQKIYGQDKQFAEIIDDAIWKAARARENAEWMAEVADRRRREAEQKEQSRQRHRLATHLEFLQLEQDILKRPFKTHYPYGSNKPIPTGELILRLATKHGFMEFWKASQLLEPVVFPTKTGDELYAFYLKGMKNQLDGDEQKIYTIIYSDKPNTFEKYITLKDNFGPLSDAILRESMIAVFRLEEVLELRKLVAEIPIVDT